VVAALVEAGLYNLFVPRAFGGLEAEPLTALQVIEELAFADGAAGWCVLIAAQSAAYTTALAPEVAAALWAGEPPVICAGTGRPEGRAVAVEGGYRITGQWPFVSGAPQATWVFGGCRVFDGEAVRVDAQGRSVIRQFWFPASAATIVDTWRSTGLRGSGSHDVAVTDVFVPEERGFRIFLDPPRLGGPLYRELGVLWALHGSHALGVARHAVEALIELAQAKLPNRTAALLRDTEQVQERVGEAEALIGAGRAFLEQAVGAVWEAVRAGGTPTGDQRVATFLAATHAARAARRAVGLMYEAGGSSAVYAANPLDRCWRDSTTATAHAAVSPRNGYLRAGRLALGLDPDPYAGFR
jgi:alkylation response protein AidB-like acyl-CoA dehydrogenase